MANDDELTGLGVGAICIFIIFLFLAFGGAIFTQVQFAKLFTARRIYSVPTQNVQKKVGNIGGLPCFLSIKHMEGFTNPISFHKAEP